MNCPKCSIPIKDHPANSCLDAVFVELVLKRCWHRWAAIDNKGGSIGKYSDYECKKCGKILYHSDEPTHPHPSTNISHAFEGVEKLELWTSLDSPGLGWQHDYWIFTVYTKSKTPVQTTAKTAPLAITRALILWAMEKKGG